MGIIKKIIDFLHGFLNDLIILFIYGPVVLWEMFFRD